ncbi:hypothetical protein F5X99DRAFT_430456 [Biscogniauxia marginata]|nr:hypothetical protein F5X99DRAFT_430456 [Biscogniauxia marginata]
MESSNEPVLHHAKTAKTSKPPELSQNEVDDGDSDHQITEASMTLVQMKFSWQVPPDVTKSVLMNHLTRRGAAAVNQLNINGDTKISGSTVNLTTAASTSQTNAHQSSTTNSQEISSGHSTKPRPSPELPSDLEESEINTESTTASNAAPAPSTGPTAQPQGPAQTGTAQRPRARAPAKTTKQSHQRSGMIRDTGTLNPKGPCGKCLAANRPCYIVRDGVVCDYCTEQKTSSMKCNVLSEEQKAAKEAQKAAKREEAESRKRKR